MACRLPLSRTVKSSLTTGDWSVIRVGDDYIQGDVVGRGSEHTLTTGWTRTGGAEASTEQDADEPGGGCPCQETGAQRSR